MDGPRFNLLKRLLDMPRKARGQRLDALGAIRRAVSGLRIMGSFYKDRLMTLAAHDGRVCDLPQDRETSPADRDPGRRIWF